MITGNWHRHGNGRSSLPTVDCRIVPPAPSIHLLAHTHTPLPVRQARKAFIYYTILKVTFSLKALLRKQSPVARVAMKRYGAPAWQSNGTGCAEGERQSVVKK